MTDNRELILKIAFSRLRGINVKLAKEILPRVGGEARFFEMTSGQLAAVMGFKSKMFNDDIRHQAIDDAQREERFITANSIRALYFTDNEYPVRLHDCDDAPVMLYALGTLDFNSVSCLSIVGTRHATVYGTTFTSRLVNHIAAAVEDKTAIVSGLAFGIDIAAHRAALSAGIPTVAVLAHGLNTIYPAAHRNDAAAIVSNGGALLTEYCAIDPVHKGNFLSRNRIVAGLSEAVIVAESGIKGGAMATARIAADYSRDVYALPGRISDQFSAGCNSLIERNIAGIITDAETLVDHMGWKMRTSDGIQSELFKELTPLQQRVIDLLSKKGEMRLIELQMQLNEPAGRLSGTLVDLEFYGLIASIPGGRYCII